MLRVGILLLWVASLVGCGTDEPAPSTIKVGALVSLTGTLGDFGPLQVDAVRLAVREVNAAGGLLGNREVELVVGDDATDPDTARTAMAELIAGNVVSVMGGMASSSTLNTHDLSAIAQIPQVSCCSSSPLLTSAQPARDRYLFRTVPSDLFQGTVMARQTTRLSCRALAIAYVDDAYGTPFVEVVRTRYLEENPEGSVVAEVGFRAGQASFPAEASALSAGRPDCIAAIGFAEDLGGLIRSVATLGTVPDVQWILSEGGKSDGLVVAAADETILSRVTGVSAIVVRSAPEYQRFVSDFDTAYGYDPSFGSWGYDAMALMLLAIERAGTTDGPAVRDALYEVSTPSASGDDPVFGPGELSDALARVRAGEDINFEGAGGPVDLDDFGDVITDYEVWRYDQDADTFPQAGVISAGQLSTPP